MKIIGFNSYKGGACRTTTCYNTVAYLCQKLQASEDKPLLIVDMDLDSMGLTKLLVDETYCPKDKFNNSFSANSLFDKNHSLNKMLAEDGLDDVKNAEYFQGWGKVGQVFGLAPGSVLFLGADANAKTISDAVFEQLKDSSPLGDLIKYLFELPEDCHPVGMIFDCAAGMQKTTQMVLSYVGTSVVCMRPTEQFRAGTLQYLKDSYKKIFDMRNCPEGSRNVILVPTSVAPIAAEKGSDAYKKIAKLRQSSFDDIEWMVNAIADACENHFALDACMVDAENADNMGIPEVERLKWKENTPLIRLTDFLADEKHALDRYEKLAQAMVG